MMDSISELSKEEQAEWHEVMLAHSYDFQDWDQARSCLLKLLHHQNQTASESAIRSYISCCAEAVSGGHPLPNLSAILEDFYQKYGMESAGPE
jgi:hypothetical protein